MENNNNISLRKGPWDKSEVEILLKNYKSKTCKELASILNRPERSIYSKLILLGIPSSDVKSYGDRTSTRNSRKKALGMKRWTPEEDEFLRKNYDTMTYTKIGKILNRTEKSVSNRCNVLKLYKQCVNVKSLTDSDINDIRELAYQGKTKKEVYKKYGIDKNTFNTLIARYDIQFESPAITDDVKEAIRRHPELKTSELAERYEVSVDSILRILNRHPGKDWNKLSDDDKRYLFRNPDNLSIEDLKSKFELSDDLFNKYTGKYIPKEIRLYLINHKNTSTDNLCSIFNIAKRTAQSYLSVFKINDINSLEEFPDYNDMPSLEKGTKKYSSKIKKVKAEYYKKESEKYYSSDKDYIKKYNFIRCNKGKISDKQLLKLSMSIFSISNEDIVNICKDIKDHDNKKLYYKID